MYSKNVINSAFIFKHERAKREYTAISMIIVHLDLTKPTQLYSTFLGI